MKIALTGFAMRLWEESDRGAALEGLTPDALVRQCNDAIISGAELVEGYAPFCRHLFVGNTTPTRCSFAPITDDNKHLLRSGYIARREGELAVLERWFEGLVAPRAEYLDVILYSREQLELEAVEGPESEPVPECDWGIVSVIGTLSPWEPPMPPITQIRNALGRGEGGSGVAIDHAAYAKAVEFWECHASVKC